MLLAMVRWASRKAERLRHVRLLDAAVCVLDAEGIQAGDGATQRAVRVHHEGVGRSSCRIHLEPAAGDEEYLFTL